MPGAVWALEERRRTQYRSCVHGAHVPGGESQPWKVKYNAESEARKKTAWGCECSGDGGGTARRAAVRADELRVEEERVFTEMKMELCVFPLRSFAAKGLTE